MGGVGRTASSAMNGQDIDVYVFMEEGIYLYDAPNHVLNPVVSGDYRNKLGSPAGMGMPATAIIVKSPRVLRATVFPPAFGPVIIMVR